MGSILEAKEFGATGDVQYTVNIQIFNTDANWFLGKRIHSTSACQAAQVKRMTHCNEGSREDLLIAAVPDPGFALSSSDLRWGAQVTPCPGGGMTPPGTVGRGRGCPASAGRWSWQT